MTNLLQVYPGHTVWEPESAVVDPIGEPYSIAYSSGGGFSNIYPIPDYQAAAVAKYVQHFPDIYFLFFLLYTNRITQLLRKSQPTIPLLRG
jgi:tripeptidyl-peptidase I